MELESIELLGEYEFKILHASSSAALVECTQENASRLILRLGGSFKIAKVISSNLSEALEKLNLPFNEKFDWTVSAYECPPGLFHEAREVLHDLLKSKKLGRSKYLEPEIEYQDKSKDKIKIAEIKAIEIKSKILSPVDGREGIDFIVHGNLGGNVIYAQTIRTSDIEGYEKRDFMRPHQEPKKTISPRIARLLVNLASTNGRMTLLDPFCGLGTILSEALLCGFAVVGVDREQANVEMSKDNLQWTRTCYKTAKRNANLFAYDARRISRARMPLVNAIATEPILLPPFRTNPSPKDASLAISKVQQIYERCIREFASLLQEKKRRVVITSPVIVDSSGRKKMFSLAEVAASVGFAEFRGRISGRRTNYPLELETGRKRIVQRGLNVFYVS